MLFLIVGLSTGIISLDKDYTVHRSIDKLNERIALTQEFEEEEWGWSWSLLLVENNLALGVKGLKGSEIIEIELDSLLLDLSFDSKLIELGYAAEFSRFIFFLSGGGGYSSVNLKSAKEVETIDFPLSLSNPEGSISYKGSSFVLSASTGFVLAVSDYLGGGVSAGYVHSLRTPEMVLEGSEDIEVQNAHNFLANGIFVHNSKINMKYPCVIMKEKGAKADVLSIALAGKNQIQDAGAKAIHLASDTTSRMSCIAAASFCKIFR